MFLSRLLRPARGLAGIDIGASTLKVVEISESRGRRTVLSVGVSETPSGIFKGHVIREPERLGHAVAELCRRSGLTSSKAAIALPGSSTFSKHLRMPRMSMKDLSAAIRAEAAHFIPADVQAVKLDFHILEDTGSNHIDVLVVAVKEEVVESFMSAIRHAEVDLVVVDVDCYALQNSFEASTPEAVASTVGLIDVGSTVSTINICRGGRSIFTGDLLFGIGSLIGMVAATLGIPAKDAERIVCTEPVQPRASHDLASIIRSNLETLASECDKQLQFYWRAAGGEDSIDRLVLSGGGARVLGLASMVQEQTGIHCDVINPFRGYDVAPHLSRDLLEQQAPLLAVSVGLALRSFDDRPSLSTRV